MPGGSATTTVSGSTPIEAGGGAEGYIEAGGGEDWFYFTVETSGTYTLWTELGNLEDTVLYLFGPHDQGVLVAWNDDQEGGTGPQLRASRIQQELAPEVYHVKVKAYRTNQKGTYTLHREGP